MNNEIQSARKRIKHQYTVCGIYSNSSDMCEIDYVVANKIYFIRNSNKVKDCTYRKGFGQRYYCACPERIDLYKKYGV